MFCVVLLFVIAGVSYGDRQGKQAAGAAGTARRCAVSTFLRSSVRDWTKEHRRRHSTAELGCCWLCSSGR